MADYADRKAAGAAPERATVAPVRPLGEAPLVVDPQSALRELRIELYTLDAAARDLAIALQAGDHASAIVAAADTQRSLASARAFARFAGMPAELEGVAERASALLAVAPKPTAGAIDDARRGDLAAWDREAAGWSPLPHLETIQRAFGHHDITNVRIRVAVAATEVFKARAFTFGDLMVFAGPPDLDLAAHEAAHVVQQRRGVAANSEAHADRVAALVVAGQSAEALLDAYRGTGGPALQRKANDAPAIARVTPAHALGNGAVLEIIPDVIGSDSAIVGMTLHANVRNTLASATTVVRTWTLLEPSGHHYVYTSQQMAAIPVSEAGPHVLEVELQSDDIVWTKQHRFTAIKGEDRTRELLPKVEDTTYEDIRGQLEVQQALLRPPAPDKQASGDYRVFTSAQNPAPAMPDESSPPLVFKIERTANTPPPKGASYQWYARPLDPTKARHRDGSQALGNLPSTTLDGQAGFFALGTTDFVSLVSNENNVFVIVCRVLDEHGKRFSEARYVQTVLSSEERKDLDKFEAYRERAEKLGDSLDDNSRTVLHAVHVATDSTRTRRPLLVAGLTKDGVEIVDLTPGLEPKENDLRFSGKDLDDAIAQLASRNRYPRGHMRVAIPKTNKLGVAVTEYAFDTTGESDLEGWSGRLGMVSLALTAAALVAAPFTEGGSVVVALLFIGSATAGVASGALSLADRLQHAEISPTGVSLDIVGIVGSLVGGAGALRGLRAGSQAINIAGQATRFVLWTNFVTSTVAAVLVSVEAAQQIEEILASDMPAADKTALLIRVVANMAMTGAMVALSYKDMAGVRSRLSKTLGSALEGALTVEARFTLSLLDDDALRALATAGKPATAEELGRLAAILRSDSQLLRSVAGRADLLDLLRMTRADAVDGFELALAETRLVSRFGAPHAQRVTATLARAKLPGKLVNGLADEALARIASDPERAVALHHQYGDAFVDALRARPAETLDELAAGLAKAHHDAPPAGVFELTNTRNVTVAGGEVVVDGALSPNALNKELRSMNGQARAHEAKVTFGPRPPGKGQPTQSTGRIEVVDAQGAKITVDVEVKPTGALDTPGGAAGPEPSRLDMLPPDPAAKRPNWTAEVTISNRVRDKDVASIVGRELDEAIGIAQRNDPTAITTQQKSVAFAPGARMPANAAAATSADRAALLQLQSLYADLDRQQQMLAGHERASTATPEMRSAVEERAARIDRLLRSMGLDGPQRFADRLDLLRNLGVGEAELQKMQVFVEQRAFATRSHPGLTATQPVMTSKVIDHLLNPRGLGGFVKGGIYGGHETNNLLGFVERNPQYAVVETQRRSAGGTTYREYEQYSWNQPGSPPPIGDPRRPGGRAFTPAEAANWDFAIVPKTTADSLQPFLRDAEVAWEQWRSNNFVAGSSPSGPATDRKGSFTTPRNTGISFEGGFMFEDQPARWTLTTVYPVLP